MNFITDTDSEQARKVLLQHKFSSLKIQTPDGHQLAHVLNPRDKVGRPTTSGKCVNNSPPMKRHNGSCVLKPYAHRGNPNLRNSHDTHPIMFNCALDPVL